MRSAEWDPPSLSRTAVFMTRSYSTEDSQLMPTRTPMRFTRSQTQGRALLGDRFDM
jgi:hypothetical protein